MTPCSVLLMMASSELSTIAARAWADSNACLLAGHVAVHLRCADNRCASVAHRRDRDRDLGPPLRPCDTLGLQVVDMLASADLGQDGGSFTCSVLRSEQIADVPACSLPARSIRTTLRLPGSSS